MENFVIKVPDIDGFQDVEVIDILVNSGDSVEEDDPLITLESDKASMDIHSLFAGAVSKIHIKLGYRGPRSIPL